MAKSADDDEIGYGKPPKQFWWPKGVSGNPRGREKGHRGLKTDLEAALNAISTLENKLTGKKIKGPNQQHAINRLVERAALGDIKAQALLFPMVMQVLGAEDRHTGPKKLSAVDQAILAEMLGERMTRVTKDDPRAETGGNGHRALLPPEAAAAADDPGDGEEGEDGDGDDDECDSSVYPDGGADG